MEPEERRAAGAVTVYIVRQNCHSEMSHEREKKGKEKKGDTV